MIAPFRAIPNARYFAVLPIRSIGVPAARVAPPGRRRLNEVACDGCMLEVPAPPRAITINAIPSRNIGRSVSNNEFRYRLAEIGRRAMALGYRALSD